MESIISVEITRAWKEIYNPRYLSISTGEVIGCESSRNLAFYLGYCSQEQFEERVIPIRDAMEKYNSIVNTLWTLPGFSEFFAEHGSAVSKEDIAEKYGADTANLAFSLKSPPGCSPDLRVFAGFLQLQSAAFEGKLLFNDQEYIFDIDGTGESYPDTIDGKICFWNWDKNSTDYALCFAKYVLEKLPRKVAIYTEPLCQFDYYYEWRGEVRPIIDAINEVFSSMEQRGYLTRYLLKAESCYDIWNYYTGMDNGTVGLYLCDPKAFEDKLLVARINALFDECVICYDDNDAIQDGLLVDKEKNDLCLKIPHYYLQDNSDVTYLSGEPGTLGGHYKLKIYGRLDCPSAARFLQKGQYIKNRVFFKDKETAIAAGYRPCAKCMPKEYKKWKNEG